MKVGDDCRQEQLALQLIEQFRYIFEIEEQPLWVFPYRMLVLNNEASLIETIISAQSLHQLKKNNNGITLYQYFVKVCSSSP